MGRPGDWSVLGGADPAPGNVQDMQEAARAWGQNAGRLGDARVVLQSATVEGAGSTVEAVRTLLHRDAALIGIYQGACETNANVYLSWASSLEDFQAEADRLRVQAEQAQLEQAQGVALLRVQAPPSLFNDAPARPNPLQELWEMDRRRGHGILASANQSLAEIQRQADDLRARYKNEGNRLAEALHVPAPSDAAQQAHLDGSVPVGSGALTALLNPGKDPQLKQLNSLRDKVNTGDVDARAEYLSLLASLTPAQLALYGVWNPDAARNSIPAPVGEDVLAAANWWASLPQASKAALIAAVPGIIGNLNGVPYSDRAKANSTNIDAIYNDPNTTDATKKTLDTIKKQLEPKRDLAGNPIANRTVITFELNNGKPLAALAIGDMDTAGNVTWNIPGMGTTVDDGLESWTGSAQDLFDEQRQALVLRGQRGTTTAVVSWVGYDTPAMPLSPEVLTPYKALAGGDRLAAALDGFHTTRNGSTAGLPKVNVVAHSYGTTTASYALTKTHFNIDTVTMFGSAGIDPHAVPNASALHVKSGPDHQPAVYVTQASNDRVAPYLGIGGSQALGQQMQQDEWMRVSPSDPDFGGHNFSSEGGYDPVTGQAYKMVTGHGAKGSSETFGVFVTTTDHGYLDLGTQSAHNIALASTGHGDQIPKLVPLKQEWAPVLPDEDSLIRVNIDPWRTFPDESDQDPATLTKG
ncbi:alpha/beta hydrolase [Pseudarthrobacter sp. NS4]|uniref:alpha/beta hydrolase n=1 Tax=Pseudarthrobacter sp. NS4 TaxID=2973976 RepID=UPI002163F3C2|nr:alpha/beta hydrolase [Pseudarthrobacter sp. NS4]